MATVAAVAETGPFTVGERALIPFTDKNYEAKILKAEYRQENCKNVYTSFQKIHMQNNNVFREDGLWYYFVHYNGWNKKFDAWVEEVGLIKMPAGSEMPVPVSHLSATA
jgi:mortality factor 4-like protein 1